MIRFKFTRVRKGGERDVAVVLKPQGLRCPVIYVAGIAAGTIRVRGWARGRREKRVRVIQQTSLIGALMNTGR